MWFLRFISLRTICTIIGLSFHTVWTCFPNGYFHLLIGHWQSEEIISAQRAYGDPWPAETNFRPTDNLIWYSWFNTWALLVLFGVFELRTSALGAIDPSFFLIGFTNQINVYDWITQNCSNASDQRAFQLVRILSKIETHLVIQNVL